MLTSLTAIFGNSPEKEAEGDSETESEKLLNLYRNRAELKKEFEELRAEKIRLQDSSKEHEGAAARVQQKLDNLENLLLDPEWVHNVVTFFQLRNLNQRCQRKLAKFAEELKQQRERNQQRQLLQGWDEEREIEASAVQQEIGQQRTEMQVIEDSLQAERRRLASMNAFERLFRRGSGTASLEATSAKIERAQQNERELLQRLEEIENREPPGTQGLDIATKRRINFMILAFAQQLYLHFCEDGVAGMAKEAGEKSVGAIKYGDKTSCDEILALASRRSDALEIATDFADILRRRVKLIAEDARFRDDNDAVPQSATVSTVYAIDANGMVSEDDANLLGENYWNIADVMSR